MAYGTWSYGRTTYGSGTGASEVVHEATSTIVMVGSASFVINIATGTLVMAAGSPAGAALITEDRAFGYVYLNVGVNITNERTGVEYVYENVGIEGTPWFVGPLPIYGKKEDAVEYVYENVT